MCYNKGKGRGWDEGDRKPKRRALHSDSRGERCFVGLKEQQKGIWLVEELKLDRTQPETILQEAMQAVGDFLRKQKMQLLLGCRSAQSWFARYPQQDLLAQKVKTKPGF